MRRLLVAAVAVTVLLTCSTAAPAAAGFTPRVLASGLRNPWEILTGPDGWLWVTERAGHRVLRIDPATGTTKVAATVTEAIGGDRSQDGLLGMALRLPDVYLAYSYDSDPSPAIAERFKIANFRYDVTTGTLRHRADLLTGLPASPDHDSGRLVLGPDDKLYYTIGDQGNNQFDRFCLRNRARDLPADARDRSAYQGKVLRLERDGSVPADNPVLGGVRTHVWSYGHRNAQGLVFGRGRLYASEQGPKTDDEINEIRAGGDYGWPRVAGRRDDQAYRYADWSASAPVPCSSLTYSDYTVPPSVPTHSETSFSSVAYTEPLLTVGTVPDGHDFRDRRCADDLNMCWPTVAPSSLDFYDAPGIPGWRGSLLMPALKDGTVYRIPLGRHTDPIPELRTVDRYRDVAISPDGRTVFVATDPAGSALGRNGKPTTKLEHPGAVLAFQRTAAS
ncbi:PQQ-dependent dehydrogenase (s-GDH family) [Actinoplanes octamycinicus]|uniref:PQQ-dependent dehydrogenase (S-GDH family) n=1 Tax=Actinoplanes octamycinicus TaxID=135948 RepID=A0A7W7H1C9_9ACTN|nr:glucose/sorbosone family PQQ-dependent dehydrogenase [Actinoplanes octamycinicus]MBB4742149.1 PQQ-dependent dehydrogenase (s-GDH family) [Actinoplanes octamycinicus]GIE60005.1 quinoprotein glucose dehydrogenase [Actinoplanes octamycinicus]